MSSANQLQGRVKRLPRVQSNSDWYEDARRNYVPEFTRVAGLSGINRVEFVTVRRPKGGEKPGQNGKVFLMEEPGDAFATEPFSFTWLRDNGIKMAKVYDDHENVIKADNEFHLFNQAFGIRINGKNLFKDGKYMNRLFRPVPYGKFFEGLDVYINEAMPEKYGKHAVDGLTLISLPLAKAMGLHNAQHLDSGHFTMFMGKGLVKGHYVISDQISHDVVVYGNENIKDEIQFLKDFIYVSLEPIKLGDHLMMDIQSLINLMPVFGPHQMLRWAATGIEEYKSNLLDGSIARWIDDFREDMTVSDYTKNKWVLKDAVRRQVDYRLFPNLVGKGWNLMREAMERYATDDSGKPIFRIPVPGGFRAYARVDLREHDEDGNFVSTVKRGSIAVDQQGNLWVHVDDTEAFQNRHGGCDWDDGFALIPVTGGQVVAFRNPNQWSEFGVYGLEGMKCSVEHKFDLSQIQPKQLDANKESTKKTPEWKNALLRDAMEGFMVKKMAKKLEYTLHNVIKRFNLMEAQDTNVGVVANAEMLLGVIAMEDMDLADQLRSLFPWNLERVIDSVVKDGVEADEDMDSVTRLWLYVIRHKIAVAETIVHRAPKAVIDPDTGDLVKVRENLVVAESHIFDQFMNAIEELVAQATIDILGDGAVSQNNRTSGYIDTVETPFLEFTVNDSALRSTAIDLYKKYNKSMAVVLSTAASLENRGKAAQYRTEKIAEIQERFQHNLTQFSAEERSELVKVWAYTIYSGPRSVHDSILWMADLDDGTPGTARDMLQMLANVGLGDQIHITPLGETDEGWALVDNVMESLIESGNRSAQSAAERAGLDAPETYTPQATEMGITRERRTSDERPDLREVRVWLSGKDLEERTHLHNPDRNKPALDARVLTGISEILVEDRTVTIGQDEFNLADGIDLADGVYTVFAISPYYRKASASAARNSLSVVLR